MLRERQRSSERLREADLTTAPHGARRPRTREGALAGCPGGTGDHPAGRYVARCMIERPRLFDLPAGTELSVDDRDATVRGEFGAVAWGCSSPPSSRAEMARTFDGGRAFAWRAGRCLSSWCSLASLMTCRSACTFRICGLGFWRLVSRRDASPPALTCWIADGMRGAERSIETGEYLDSALWQDERHRVQIGTVHKINRIPRGQLRADANVLPRSGVMELAHEVGRTTGRSSIRPAGVGRQADAYASSFLKPEPLDSPASASGRHPQHVSPWLRRP